MKILITGATGAVGKSMQTSSGDQLIKVSSKDADLNKYEEIRALIVNTKPDSIIHLAALSGGRQLSVKRPADLLTVNINMAQNLILSAKELGISRIGLALSGACYGSNSSFLAKEIELHSSPIIEDDYAYAYSKRFFDLLMKSYNSQFGMNIYSFVINGVIGSEMNYSPDKALMIPSLIKKIHDSRNNSGEIEVWGDGTPKRQYTWDKDISRNIIWCHKNQLKSTVLNIGTNEIITVTECAELICKNFGVDLSRLYYNKSKGNGKATQLTDNSEFTALTNYEYQKIEISLENICRKFIN